MKSTLHRIYQTLPKYKHTFFVLMRLVQGKGCILWLTGLIGSGKTTISIGVERELKTRNCLVELLDGDVVKTHLSKELGYGKQDRDTNVLSIGFVANLLSCNVAMESLRLTTAISPYRAI
ncbi:adenylyl-sulfate kinase [Scytonema sp. PCC 10023]|uniref:adenylyl-sulfate kinase n=1 Tax=Scytonema sp. PCC 10023 TaxID=1680591 RepID=UPI0039C5E8F7